MDALPYVDALIKEYLLFRGFQATLTSFTADLAADPGCGFQAERITDLIFRQLIPGLDCTALVEFLEFLNMQLYSRLDSRYERLVSAVEADLLRLFLVTAHRAGRQDAMADFFRLYGPQLISNSNSSSSSSSDAADWREWFLLPYLASPDREPRFQLYFSSEWAALLEVSFRNFIAGVVRSLPLPAVLRFNTDRRLRLALQQQVHTLQSELERTKEQLSTALGSLQQQEQQQQQQQQQTRVSAMPDTNLHRREGSLTDWQQQPQGGLQTTTSSSTPGQQEGRQQDAQQPPDKPLSRPIGGSGLFELLPQHSGALAAAAAAGTQPGVSQQQGLGYSKLNPSAKHVRGTSFSGSISFDALPALAAEGPEGLAAEHSSDREQQQLQQQDDEGVEQPGRPIPQALRGRGRGSNSSSRAAALPPALATTNLGMAPLSRSSPTGPVTLSSSPVMSWSGASSSSTGARPRHMPAGHTTVSGSCGAGGTGGSGVVPSPLSPVAVQLLSAVPPSEPVGVSHQKHAAGDAAGDEAGVAVAAFSPSGGNVASVVAGSSCVHIWSPVGLPGANPSRAAVVSCGAPVTCVAWDSRSDKLMLVGCAGGGGVRAWHSDTRRILDSVPAEPGFPVVAAVAACPSEPTFVVAANSSSGGSSGQVQGRLVAYNARSFKRSSVLSVPADAGLVSLAYSASGAQLLVGTAAGSALQYEPNSRSSPLRVWDVAGAVARGKQPGAPAATAGADAAVQVLWRPLGVHSSGGGGGGGAGGTMLTLCAGVLCEWLLSPAGSRSPVAAFDVLAAACDALSGLGSSGSPSLEEQQGRSGTAGRWQCTAAVAPDGGSVAVLCSGAAAGVLLLLGATAAGGGSSRPVAASWGARGHVLLCGEMLAGCAGGPGGGGVSWHSAGRVLVLGGGSSGGGGPHSITVTLPGGVLPS